MGCNIISLERELHKCNISLDYHTQNLIMGCNTISFEGSITYVKYQWREAHLYVCYERSAIS